MRWRFALKFLAAFAAIIPLWWALDLGEAYRRALLQFVAWTSPILSGWWLDLGSTATFRRGATELPLLLNLPAVAMGLMPLFSLMVATPGQTLVLLLLRLPLALGLCFLLHAIVILAYPVIMTDPNVFKDTAGVFAGLVAFVVAPLGIWFTVTYTTMRPLWRIGEPSTR